jgi:hypothetical protein
LRGIHDVFTRENPFLLIQLRSLLSRKLRLHRCTACFQCGQHGQSLKEIGQIWAKLDLRLVKWLINAVGHAIEAPHFVSRQVRIAKRRPFVWSILIKIAQQNQPAQIHGYLSDPASPRQCILQPLIETRHRIMREQV